jgi:putative FmdB family regulatory protein
MPTYDYVCAACRHEFEAFQEMSAKKLRKCPKCGKSALERQVGAGAGLIFKGSGFYITDYRRAGTEPESVKGPEKSGKEAAEGNAAAKAESKRPAPEQGAKGEAPTPSALPPKAAQPEAKGSPKRGAKDRA